MVSLQVASKLNFSELSLKPGLSNGFYFRGAEGLTDLDWRRAVVAYKAERGRADLQFGGTSATAALAAVSRHLAAIDEGRSDRGDR